MPETIHKGYKDPNWFKKVTCTGVSKQSEEVYGCGALLKVKKEDLFMFQVQHSYIGSYVQPSFKCPHCQELTYIKDTPYTKLNDLPLREEWEEKNKFKEHVEIIKSLEIK